MVAEAHYLLQLLSWHQFDWLPGDLTHHWTQELYFKKEYTDLSVFAQKSLAFALKEGSFNAVLVHIRDLDAERKASRWRKQKWRK